MNMNNMHLNQLVEKAREWGENLPIYKIRVWAALTVTVVFLVFFFVFIVRPQTVKLDKARRAAATMQQKADQYKHFDQFVQRLDRQREMTVKIINEYDGVLPADDEAGKTSLPYGVTAIFNTTGIKPDSLKQEDGGERLEVVFSAELVPLINSLYHIERNYRIVQATIKSGQKLSKHKVTLMLASYSYGGKQAKNSDTDDFMDLFDAASALSVAIDARHLKRQESPVIRRDPLSFIGVLAETHEPEVVYNGPRIKVDGIYWDPQTPVVVIEGRAFKTGDRYKGARLTKINKQSIEVMWHDHHFTFGYSKKKGG